MRKKLMVAALVMPVLLASCSREPANEIFNANAEMSISAVFDGTKGYVDGNTLYDGGSPRTIYLSAYNKATSKDLFVGYTYQRADDGSWKNYVGDVHTPFYWPLGAVVDFLAFSVGNEPASLKVAQDAQWNHGNSTTQVQLKILDNALLQDDILYAVNSDCKVSAGSPELHFHHAQAWVEFAIDTEKEGIKVNEIKLKNVFTTGHLTLKNNNNTPICSWDFPEIERTDHKLLPSDGGLVPTDGTSLKISVLLPKQQVLTTTCAEITFEVPNVIDGTTVKTRPIVFNHSTWLDGGHYCYQIHLN